MGIGKKHKPAGFIASYHRISRKEYPLIVKSGIAFTPNYYKEKGKNFMPYASLDNKTNHVTYQVLGSQNYDYPCMDWYLIPKMQKQAYWSEPYYDDGGGNIIMSTYSKPLYDNRGELFAVFIASISLTQFTDTISLLKPYPSSYTYLISRNGSFLTHANRDKIMNETIFFRSLCHRKPFTGTDRT